MNEIPSNINLNPNKSELIKEIKKNTQAECRKITKSALLGITKALSINLLGAAIPPSIYFALIAIACGAVFLSPHLMVVVIASLVIFSIFSLVELVIFVHSAEEKKNEKRQEFKKGIAWVKGQFGNKQLISNSINAFYEDKTKVKEALETFLKEYETSYRNLVKYEHQLRAQQKINKKDDIFLIKTLIEIRSYRLDFSLSPTNPIIEKTKIEKFLTSFEKIILSDPYRYTRSYKKESFPYGLQELNDYLNNCHTIYSLSREGTLQSLLQGLIKYLDDSVKRARSLIKEGSEKIKICDEAKKEANVATTLELKARKEEFETQKYSKDFNADLKSLLDEYSKIEDLYKNLEKFQEKVDKKTERAFNKYSSQTVKRIYKDVCKDIESYQKKLEDALFNTWSPYFENQPDRNSEVLSKIPYLYGPELKNAFTECKEKFIKLRIEQEESIQDFIIQEEKKIKDLLTSSPQKGGRQVK